MGEVLHISLERALARTEADADSAIKGAAAALSALKKFKATVKTGNLRELQKNIESAEQAISALRQQFSNAKDGWDFDEEAYFSSQAFTSELLETSNKMDLKIYEQDGRLFCYPFLINILPGESAVLIDKRREKRLRPSVLVTHLKELQNKPPRFKADAFLESLFKGYYTTLGERRGEIGKVVALKKLYGLFTLLPGLSRDYTIQEFVRDIYLLDESGTTTTKGGHVISFHASTATRTNTLRVITKDGSEKKYYGISFSAR